MTEIQTFTIYGDPVPHVTVTYRGKHLSRRGQLVAEYKERVRLAAIAAKIKLPVPSKDCLVMVRTDIYFSNGRHGDPESCHKVIKDALWPKLRRKVKGQPSTGDDKYVGGFYPPPRYDANNPRVVVTIWIESMEFEITAVLRDELTRLIAFAVTCRLNNQKEWMETFAARLNEGLQAIGDSDLIELDEDRFTIKSR